MTPLNVPPSYPISAIYKNTEPDQTAPWVMPGTYTITLFVNGQALSNQSLVIKTDPRIKTAKAPLQQQYDLSVQCYNARKECLKILEEIKAFRAKFSGDQNTPVLKEITMLETSSPGANEPSFSRLLNSFAGLFNALQDSDMPPTTQMIKGVNEALKTSNELKARWEKLKQ